MRIVRPIYMTIVLTALAILPLEETNNEAKGIRSSARDGASIAGTIFFKGRMAEPRQLDTSGDGACASFDPVFDQGIVVTDGKLANVLVYVMGPAIDGRTFDVPSSTVVLEHKKCQFEPRVLGVQTGQTLLIRNADFTTDSTSFTAALNERLNVTTERGSPPIERQFSNPELFIQVKDNQHPWERAYLNIFPHSFFSVTKLVGRYQISGLPPGHYTIVAWHEKLGEKRAELQLGSGESTSVDFTYAANVVRGISDSGTIHGGILNGNALGKHDPEYPPEARAKHVTGTVTVEVLVDERGHVESARAVAGPQQLREAAVKAAYLTTFPPTLDSWSYKPLKVAGVMVYNFRLP